jgi:hypothetical protein
MLQVKCFLFKYSIKKKINIFRGQNLKLLHARWTLYHVLLLLSSDNNNNKTICKQNLSVFKYLSFESINR